MGEARQGEGVTLDSSAPVHLTAASGTSGAVSGLSSADLGRGVFWDLDTRKITGLCESLWGSRKKSCLASSVYAALLSTETTGPRQPQSRYTSKS